ncbi:MAG: 4Fe-4S cluster-binding domain-containing protein [Ignisphaera sp.]|nr:4Fe-4S cluster-binding domain-containing protein [Ignisphaera sp.]
MFKIVEMFKSIQSEGHHSGTPASFIRFFGCNLDCNFGEGKVCDEPLHTDKSKVVNYSMVDIIKFTEGIDHIVITGGEPSLHYLNALITQLQLFGHYVQVETNGENLDNISNADWITYSPKTRWSVNAKRLLEGYDELKLPASKDNLPAEIWNMTLAKKYIQPISFESELDLDNIRWCANYVMENPDWKLSIQLHKLYGGK